MPGQRCTVCGTSRNTNPEESFHRVPRQEDRRASWLKEFSLQEDDVKACTQVFATLSRWRCRGSNICKEATSAEQQQSAVRMAQLLGCHLELVILLASY